MIAGQAFETAGHCYPCQFPLRSAVVHFEDPAASTRTSHRVSTDGDGAFSISLPAGTYRIWVESEPATVRQVQITPVDDHNPRR
jgi:hypothetical protein